MSGADTVLTGAAWLRAQVLPIAGALILAPGSAAVGFFLCALARLGAGGRG